MTPDTVLGIVSLIFWSLIVVISIKYAERMLRGRIHYCRLIETNSQKSAYRSGAGHTFGSDRAGHLVQYEAPDAFKAALVEGLDALAAERVREEHRQ